MSLTIREDFYESFFLKISVFFRKSQMTFQNQIFQKKSVFLKIFVSEKPSRMVKLIFGADHKSIFRIIVYLADHGDWLNSELSSGRGVESWSELDWVVVSAVVAWPALLRFLWVSVKILIFSKDITSKLGRHSLKNRFSTGFEVCCLACRTRAKSRGVIHPWNTPQKIHP